MLFLFADVWKWSKTSFEDVVCSKRERLDTPHPCIVFIKYTKSEPVPVFATNTDRLRHPSKGPGPERTGADRSGRSSGPLVLCRCFVYCLGVWRHRCGRWRCLLMTHGGSALLGA